MIDVNNSEHSSPIDQGLFDLGTRTPLDDAIFCQPGLGLKTKRPIRILISNLKRQTIMFKWIISRFVKDDWDSVNDMQKMAIRGGIDRRRNARICYPALGPVGKLPYAFVGADYTPVIDISVGGICLIDQGKHSRALIGTEQKLQLKWRDGYVAEVEARIAGASFRKRHIQFTHLPEEAFLRINVDLHVGHLGRRLRQRASHLSESQINLDAQEIWSGVTGELLTIYPGPGLRAELKLFNHDILLKEGQLPTYCKSDQQVTKGQRVSQEMLGDIILFLANVERPSTLVNDLIRDLHLTYQAQMEVA